MEEDTYDLELEILKRLKGRFVKLSDEKKKAELITNIAKSLAPNISPKSLKSMMEDMDNIWPITPFLDADNIEDIMINNTRSVFVYDSKEGQKKLDVRIPNREALNMLIAKLELYATNEAVKDKIMDVHMPNGSRANIVSSPMGFDVTIRNFKKQALSIIDLINFGELNYQIAARLWIYVDGFKVRPANLLFGGMPAAGKTSLLNAMFSFLRPETRIVTIEETYELNTETQENCVRLETSEDVPMDELVKNALRMRPDLLIIGEVRGPEASDMITAMNIGKIAMSTIHASSSRDIINRLQHSNMNVPQDMIPAIDALVLLSQLYEKGAPVRKIVQISEISGIETQVLLSDLYRFDYKLHKGAPILPSITYRDTVAGLLGIPPSDVLAEEDVRANILYKMNELGTRDMVSINNMVRDYYNNPDAMLKKLGLSKMKPAVFV